MYIKFTNLDRGLTFHQNIKDFLSIHVPCDLLEIRPLHNLTQRTF